MRAYSALLLLTMLGGCAGYAIDYVRPRTAIVGADQFSRFGLNETQSMCVGGRLQSDLSVWQLRQFADAAAAARRVDGSALGPGDIVTVAGTVTDPRVRSVVAQAVEACEITGQAGTLAAAPTARGEAAADAPAATAAPAPSPAGSVDAPAATSTAWVNLGAAATGQAIAVEGSSVRQEGSNRRAWFRLTNPGQVGSSTVSYHLRIDCTGRTINPMAFRQYGPTGTVIAEREYGPNGEGAIAVEGGTVMEIAYLALCT